MYAKFEYWQSISDQACIKQLSMSQLKHLTFGTMVIAETPNTQVKESIGAKAVGITVGFEQSRPENFRVFIPASGTGTHPRH